MANYSQPDYRVPTTDPRVGVQVENNRNVLNVTAAQPAYAQPGTSAPSAPVANQLADAMGKSKITHADGTSSST